MNWKERRQDNDILETISTTTTMITKERATTTSKVWAECWYEHGPPVSIHTNTSILLGDIIILRGEEVGNEWIMQCIKMQKNPIAPPLHHF